MTNQQTQQFKNTLKDKKHVLIVFDAYSRGDGICSAAAMSLFLKQMGIRSDIVSPEFSLPQNYEFVKHAKKIRANTGHLQKFILSLDISKTGIKELSYDVVEDQLRIFVTPKKGTIEKENITTKHSGFLYDAIIILDTPDPKSLGDLYMNNAEFFARTPMINIDHKSHNTHFGHVNMVDVTASTTAEILFDLFKRVDDAHVSKHIAEALLTGMISSTNSFRAQNVKHHTLAHASELVKLGADRRKIITNLYQTKSIATFKLWGAALTNLKHDAKRGIAWTTITRDELVRSGASELDLPAIIDELISNTPEATIVMLLHEHTHSDGDNKIHGIIQTQPPHNPHVLSKKVKGVVYAQNISFVVTGGKTLKEVEQEVLGHIEDFVEM